MTREIPDSATIVVADDVVASDFGEELVVLNLRDGVYYGLEDVGVRIWRGLQQPVSFVDLRDQIVSEYEVEPDDCDRDVRELVAELAAAGLIEITMPPG